MGTFLKMFANGGNLWFSPCPDCGEEEGEPFFLIGMPFGKGTRIFSISGEFPHYAQANFTALNEFLWDLRILDKEPAPIIIEFNSPGGASGSLFTMLDVLQTLRSPVYTVAHQADSAAGILTVVAGEAGHRYMYPDGRIILHNGKGGSQDGRFERYSAKDINGKVISYLDGCCDADKMLMDRKSGGWKPTDDVLARRIALAELFNDDQYFDAQEAISYRLVDHIITPEIAQQLFAPPVKPKRGQRA